MYAAHPILNKNKFEYFISLVKPKNMTSFKSDIRLKTYCSTCGALLGICTGGPIQCVVSYRDQCAHKHNYYTGCPKKTQKLLKMIYC